MYNMIMGRKDCDDMVGNLYECKCDQLYTRLILKTNVQICIFHDRVSFEMSEHQ